MFIYQGMLDKLMDENAELATLLRRVVSEGFPVTSCDPDARLVNAFLMNDIRKVLEAL